MSSYEWISSATIVLIILTSLCALYMHVCANQMDIHRPRNKTKYTPIYVYVITLPSLFFLHFLQSLNLS